MTVLDQAALDDLRALGGEELVTEVIEAYRKEATADVAALLEAVTGADIAGLERLAHRLKSASFSVGATSVAEFAEQLERLSRGGTTEGAPQIAQALNAAWLAAIEELQRLRPAA